MGANTSSSGYPMATPADNTGANCENVSGNVSVLESLTSTRMGSSGSGGGPGTSVSYNGLHYHHRDQRRKRVTGFATLKRKFIRRRRSSKACDHARVLRDFVCDWTPLELAALCEEFEALSALRDLSVQAELARPPASTYKQDLAALYDLNLCTDCDLVFRGSIFPVHRSILSSRCSYFRDLLSGCPGYGARICLDLSASPIDVQIFSSLLRYLYTGDLCPHDPTININLLRQLSDDFGTPNPLEHDLRYLLETGDYADAALVFTADGSNDSCLRQDASTSEYGFRPKLELPCHKAILSARSPFFRNLIARRTRNIDEYIERSTHVPTRIVLDESVIPKRYARVLLQAIYLDTVDLTLILRSGGGTGNSVGSVGSLGEVHALTNTGRMRPTTLEEAMELYQIGRFLELDILAQGCEDLILEWLSLDTLSMVLKWGCQPHGSAWVFRQACQYLREEFAAVSASPVLCQLDKGQLVHILQSNFLQASELEILQAVLKWGEQELIRRMEDREPNLLSHTAHSVTRKGVKRRDLSDIELREILSELLPLVRMDHVLPPNSEVLCHAIRRGLVSTPPSHMISDERDNLRVNAWIRGGKNQGLFVRPRLFMPYFEEVKALLEDRIATSHHQVELQRMRRSRHFPDIPDTLYMVSQMNVASTHSGGFVAGTGRENADKVDSTALPPPDSLTISAMRKREHKLRQSPMCQRALLLPLSSRHEIDCQIRLRVVREFNLPDEVSDILENSLLNNKGNNSSREECNDVASTTHQTEECLLENHGDQSPPPSPAVIGSATRHISTAVGAFLSTTTSSVASSSAASSGCGIEPCYSRNLTFPRHQQQSSSLLGVSSLLANNSNATRLQSNFARLSASAMHHRNELPALITEGDLRFPRGGNALNLDRITENSSSGLVETGGGNGNGHLSDMMPDVAMATASLGQLHLSSGGGSGSGCVSNHTNNRHIGSSNNDMSESLQLDLGDGPIPHIINNAAAAGVMSLRDLQQQLPQNSYHHHIMQQRSNSPFDTLRQGLHSPAPPQNPHPPSGALNPGPPRFL